MDLETGISVQPAQPWRFRRNGFRFSFSVPSLMPWKGKPGIWRQYLDGGDLAFFASQAGNAMARLGYEI